MKDKKQFATFQEIKQNNLQECMRDFCDCIIKSKIKAHF